MFAQLSYMAGCVLLRRVGVVSSCCGGRDTGGGSGGCAFAAMGGREVLVVGSGCGSGELLVLEVVVAPV